MNSERLARMLSDALAFDTETDLTQPGLAAPPLVCASCAWWEAGRVIGKIMDPAQARDLFLAAICNETVTLAVANGAFDMLVMACEFAREGRDILPEIFAAYEAGRVFDIRFVEMLHHIALGMLGKDPRTGRKLTDPETGRQGYYSLNIVHDLVHGEVSAKRNDKWRKSYALLRGIPIAKWQEVTGSLEAEQYPVDDSVHTLRDALAQAGHIPNVGRHDIQNGRCTQCHKPLVAGLDPKCVSSFQRRNIHDAAVQAYTHWCMALGAAWGLTPDPIAVARLKAEALKDYAEDRKPFIAAGIIRGDECGAKAGTVNEGRLKRYQAEAYGAKDPCPVCASTRTKRGEPVPGKVPSPATNGRTLINCAACDGSGLLLPASVPRTPTGEIAIGRDPCSESGSELMMSWAAFGEDKKIGTVYVPFLEEGVIPDYRLVIPDGASHDEVAHALSECEEKINAAKARGDRITIPITLFPNPLLETNRTGYFGVIQLLPRNGGVRDCFIPRPGFVYYSNDYGGLELCTWSQINLWFGIDSHMAKAINSGMNVHAMLGAKMAGVSYDELLARIAAGDKQAKEYRGAAKWGNFGFMADMGPVRFVHQLRMQGQDTEHPTGPIEKNGKRIYRGQRLCILIGGRPRCGERMLTVYNKEPIVPTCEACVEQAKRIKADWRATWPEEKQFFAVVKRIADQGWQKHPISKRIRGGIGYSDGANGLFQELAAQGAKDALRHVVREQYDRTYRPADLGHESVLLGNSRTIVFLHDELLGEGREKLGHEIGERVSTVMEARMAVYCPDVKVKAEPTLMPRWWKQAAMVRDANGRLQIWQPQKKAA